MINLYYNFDIFNYTKDNTYKRQKIIENNNYVEINRLMPLNFERPMKQTNINFGEITSVDCSVQAAPTSTSTISSYKVPKMNTIINETPIKAHQKDKNEQNV